MTSSGLKALIESMASIGSPITSTVILPMRSRAMRTIFWMSSSSST